MTTPDNAATVDASGSAAPGEGDGTGTGEREAQNGSQCPRCGTSWTAEIATCPHCQDAHPSAGAVRPGCGHISGIHDEFCDQAWYEPEPGGPTTTVTLDNRDATFTPTGPAHYPAQGAMDAAIEAAAVATESHMADIGVRAAEPLLRQAVAEEIALRLRDAGLVKAVEIAREVGRVPSQAA